MIKYIIEIDMKAEYSGDVYEYAPHIYNTQQDAENAACALFAANLDKVYLVSIYEALLSRKAEQETVAERVAVYRNPDTRSDPYAESPAALDLYTRKHPHGERILGLVEADHEYDLTTGRTYRPQASARAVMGHAEPVQIGMGHLIRSMQITGWGHEEIMAMREALITQDFGAIHFCPDCYTDDWEDKHRITALKLT